MLSFSLSAMQTWQRCEQRYYYSYVRKLRPLQRAIAPERGVILHAYLAEYYQGLLNEAPPLAAHQAGLATIMLREREMKASAASAFYAGLEDEAREYLALVPSCVAIADRYFRARGERDAERYDVEFVEQDLEFKLATGIMSRSIIDLVLIERDTGLRWLVEHKSTRAVPDSAVRLRDLQTLLYAEVLERINVHVDGVLWNYLRTKEPDVPHQNKDGRFSRAVSIDTTWEIYRKAVLDAGQPEEAYHDVRTRLADKELTTFFPRFEHIIVADTAIMLNDYVQEALRMRLARTRWQRGSEKPVRTIQRDCTYCEFYRCCEAAIMGGDEEDVIRVRFTDEYKKEAKKRGIVRSTNGSA